MPPSPNRIAFYRDRCKPRLTQKGLAAALGIHVNTITLWEREGVSSAANLLRMVHVFVERGAIADAAAALHFWENSGRERFELPIELAGLFTPIDEALSLPGAIQPTGSQIAPSVLPFAPNTLFIGRSDDFAALAGAFQHTQIVAVSGIGGMGKTQLAAEFAHRYGRCFAGGVFWINCESASTIAAQVAQCGGAGRLDLRPHFADYSLEEQVRMVQGAWQSPIPRLLIFDNCEQATDLEYWRPATGGCRILVTSRRTHWPPVFGTCVHLLTALSTNESIALLRRYLPATSSCELEELANELGGLPLAIHMAGSFLARYGRAVAPAEYAQQLRSTGALPHAHMLVDEISPTKHWHDVDRTFALSYDRLDRYHPQDQAAIELAARIACLGPGEAIEVALVHAICTNLAAPLEFEAAMQHLLELGIIEYAADDSVRMHRLQAAFTRRQIDCTNAREVVARMLFQQIELYSERSNFTAMLALQPHIYAVVSGALLDAAPWSAKLSGAIGWELTRLADYATARQYLDRSLALNLGTYGPDHSETAEIYNLLGLWLQLRGDIVQARENFIRASAIRAHAFGPLHLKTAQSYTNLGYLLLISGEFTEAEHYLKCAQNMLEHLRPPDHPDISRILNNLGFLYFRSGRLAESRPFLERALALRQQTLPDPHLATALTLTSIGELYFCQGELSHAEHMLQRGFTMRTLLIQGAHNAIAESLNRLGHVQHARGDLAGAEALHRQALAVQQQLSHPNPYELAVLHLDLAKILEGRGTVDEIQKNLDIARTLLTDASPGLITYYLGNPMRLQIGAYATIRGIPAIPERNAT